MTPKQLGVLQHALGVDQYGRGRQYRNHYVAGADDVADCQELVEMGHMTAVGASSLTGGGQAFFVTDFGKQAVISSSPKPPKLTRAQARYERWLAADSGMKFGEWIRMENGS